MKEILTTYTAYNLWANTQIVDALKENSSVLDVEIKSSFPSIRKTVYHLWGCEELWWKRVNEGESPGFVPNMDFPGKFEDASQSWLSFSEKFASLPRNQNENYFSSVCNYKDTHGNSYSHPRWWMIHHCMNHSTFHRGQIVTMVREAGLTKIPRTDLIVFLRDTK